MVVDWVALINPEDLHTLALTNSVLFGEAEKYRWNTLSIRQNSTAKYFEGASEVLFRVEGRPARVVNLRLTACEAPPRTMLTFNVLVDRLLKEARGLRTLHLCIPQQDEATLRLFNGFKSFPFKLTEFAIYFYSQCGISDILDFLVSQPTIERLFFHFFFRTRATKPSPLPNGALPNLAALSAPPYYIDDLARGRPVKYLRFTMQSTPESTLQMLEATLQKSIQPLTAISLCGVGMIEITFLLSHLLRLAPGLRFLGCELLQDGAGSLPKDMQPLRAFTKLKCIRWRCLSSVSERQLGRRWRGLNPLYYAGPSLQAVQQEFLPPFAQYGGLWRASGDQTEGWRFHVGEFISPPLSFLETSLVRATPTYMSQVSHAIRV